MTGLLLNCYHPFEFSVTGIAQWLIRLITKGADHTAILMENVGELHVVEASYERGAVILMEWEEWQKCHPGVKYTTSFPIYSEFNERDFKHLLKSQVGKRYDVRAVLWYMLLYQVKKVWLGRTDNGRADQEFFCSELAMFAHKRDNWYRMTPADVENHPDFVNDYRYVTT